jgi:hypothetical protein
MHSAWLKISAGVVATLVAVVLLWPGARAQAPETGWRYAPVPAGQPDFQGVWKVWNHAQYDVEDHSARPGIPAGKGVVVDPPDGRIPYLPWALKQREENYKNSRDPHPLKSADSYHKCYGPGVPRITYLGWPFQIVQTEKYVAFLYEWMHHRRVAYYDASPPEEGIELWNGHARARWEGKTLVVDTVNFNGLTWLDQVGNFTSNALHVVERYSMLNQDTLEYEVTLEDPKVYARPWKMRMPIHRQKDLPLLEYECHALLEESGISIGWERH